MRLWDLRGGSCTSAINIWDGELMPLHAPAEQLKCLKNAYVSCVAFDPTGNWLMAGTGNAVLTLWSNSLNQIAKQQSTDKCVPQVRKERALASGRDGDDLCSVLLMICALWDMLDLCRCLSCNGETRQKVAAGTVGCLPSQCRSKLSVSLKSIVPEQGRGSCIMPAWYRSFGCSLLVRA